MKYRNATDAKQAFRNAARDFRELYLPRIRAARDQNAAANPGNIVPEGVKVALEAHGRNYLIDSLLTALNWNITSESGAYLANLIPENPIYSTEENETRYIDYLGFDTDTQNPLMVVEAKRPGSPLPARKTPKNTSEPVSEILLAGVRGTKLQYDWDDWLKQVRDYVVSIQLQTGVSPKRLVMTDGLWLFVFLEPEALFRNPANAKATDIRAFAANSIDENFHGEIDEQFEELYGLMEFNRLADSLPPLSPAELRFHFGANDSLEALHGVLLNYISYAGQFRPTPLIEITPVIFLRKLGQRWLRVELKDIEVLPSDSTKLSAHMQEVTARAASLREKVTGMLPGNYRWLTLEEHFADPSGFAQLPGVRDTGNKYVVVTGSHTHYLREQPSVPECPYHQWTSAQAEGAAAPTQGPIAVQSTSPGPRVWFPDGSMHHCAHLEIDKIKSHSVAPGNRAQCGTRSAKDNGAFCEIRGFEQHLCCRTCNFESVCESAVVFQPPCHPWSFVLGA